VAEAATVGNYVLERELGRGGMGAVYAGVHKLVGRRAAIKVLLPDLSRKQDLVDRFFNEARAAARIKHPSIVDIYDYGYAGDGSAYIVMELLEGETLATRLKARGPMPIPAACALARQVANALGAAHALGIIHRDLKPDNVFLVKDPEVAGGERVKLLDFGIAKLATDTAGVSATVTGAILGTPHYMSPEQCEGSRVVDARTDLYSLGCMLFQMLTGQLPFDSPGIGGLIGMHLHVPPPLLRSRLPVASAELEAVVARLLAKPVDERFQSAEAVANALGAPAVSAEMAAQPAHATNASASQDGPTDVGMAHTMQTPASRPPASQPPSTQPPTQPPRTETENERARERDTQARAETVPFTAGDLANISLRPPSLPAAADASRASGKLRPPRGDDPTVPSLPPEMTANQAPTASGPSRAPAPSGTRKQIVIIVSVVVVALGAFLVVNFTNNKDSRKGGVETGETGDTRDSLASSSNGSGDSYAGPPPADAAVPVEPPTPAIDPESFTPRIEEMKALLGKKEYKQVKAIHDEVVEATKDCGEPCNDLLSAVGGMMSAARIKAGPVALSSVEKEVKAGDCDGARRVARSYEGLVDEKYAVRIESSIKSCKAKSTGGGDGSGDGSADPIGDGSGSGSGDGSGSGSGDGGDGSGGENPLIDAFRAGEYSKVLEECTKRRRLGKQGKIACAISACKLNRKVLMKSYLAGLGPDGKNLVRQQCAASAGADDGNTEQTPPPPPPGTKD
jgi:serine/threonine protein kinase